MDVCLENPSLVTRPMHGSLLPAKCFAVKALLCRIQYFRSFTFACSSITHTERSVSIATMVTRRRHDVRFHLHSVSSSNNKATILQPPFSTSVRYAKYSKTCEFGHLCKSATCSRWSYFKEPEFSMVFYMFITP